MISSLAVRLPRIGRVERIRIWSIFFRIDISTYSILLTRLTGDILTYDLAELRLQLLAESCASIGKAGLRLEDHAGSVRGGLLQLCDGDLVLASHLPDLAQLAHDLLLESDRWHGEVQVVNLGVHLRQLIDQLADDLRLLLQLPVDLSADEVDLRAQPSVEVHNGLAKVILEIEQVLGNLALQAFDLRREELNCNAILGSTLADLRKDVGVLADALG